MLLRMTGIAEEIKVKIIRLSFFGQALNNTSERSEESIKRKEKREKRKEEKFIFTMPSASSFDKVKAASKRAKTKLV